MAALAPIAYSFDGWIIATSITGEVKNPKRNMPLALIIGPIIILSVYLLYFLGFEHMLGSEYIMSTKDGAVTMVGTLLFGKYGSSILMMFVTIAVIGVVNGISLGSIRIPQALASKNMLPNSEKIATINPKYEISLMSGMISYVVTVFWMLLHYITQKSGILGNSDISEISIVFSYCCYVVLYIKVIRMKKENIIKSFFKGFVCPILAFAGSIIILICGLISNPVYVPFFILFCSLVCLVGYLYTAKKQTIIK